MSKRFSNLLSWRFRLYILIRRRLFQWSLIWVGAVLLSLGWWQLRIHRLHAAEDRVALMETRYNPLKQMQAENQKIRQQLAQMTSHESLLTRLDDEQVPYRLLALVSLQVGERLGTVRLDSFQLMRTEATAVPVSGTGSGTAAAAQSAAERTQLTIRGLAADNLAVSLFVAGLRDTGVFQNVDLRSSVGARIEKQRAQSFIIECGF